MAARRRRAPDPPAQLAELAKSLDGEELARGYVLRGEERYFHERAIDLVCARAAALGHEVCRHDVAPPSNPDFRLSTLIDDLSGGGLFAARRLVVVRNPGDLLKKVEGHDAPLTEAVCTFVAAEDAGCVVLSASSLRADHAVCRGIQRAGGRLLDLRKLWDTPPQWNPDPRRVELVEWTLRRAGELDVRLSPDQAVYVCAATGNDLAALDDQLERLRSTPRGELREIVGWDAATSPWSVSDALVAGELPDALAGIEALYRAGFRDKSGRRLVDAGALSNMLIGSLTRGVRRSLALSTALERGATEEEAARSLGLAGRVVGPAIVGARRRAAASWRAMLEDVAELDRRAKSAAGVDANDLCALALRWRPEVRPG